MVLPPPVIEHYLSSCQLHILAGSSGAGKTSVVAFMLKRIIEGDLVFGHKTHRPAFIGYMAGDRTLTDTRGHFENAGVDCDAMKFYGVIDDKSAGVEADISSIGTAAGEFGLFRRALSSWSGGQPEAPSGSLIFIDGLLPMLGINVTSNNPGRDIYRPLLHLGRRCLNDGWTLVLIHQGVKQKGDLLSRYARLQDRTSGSMHLQACTGSQLHISEPEGDKKSHEFVWVSHRAPREVHYLQRGDRGEFFEVAAPPASPTEAQVKEQKQSPVEGEVIVAAGKATPRAEIIKGMVPLEGLPQATLCNQLVAAYPDQEWPRASVYRILNRLIETGELLRDKQNRLFKPEGES